MPVRIPMPARALLALGAASAAVVAANAAFGIGGATLADRQPELLALSLLAASAATWVVAASRTGRFRYVWGAVALGQLCFAAGEIYFDFFQDQTLVSFPTPADVLWLAYYPLVAVAVAFFVTDRASLRPLVWLDGAILFLVLVALAFAWAFGDVLASAVASKSFVQAQLSYPLLDLSFVAAALVLGFMGRWRLGPAYWVASGAAVLFFAIDWIFFEQLASETYVPGTLLEVGWPAVMLLMSLAAQLPLRRPALAQASTWRTNAVLAAAMLPALALLVRGTDVPGGTASVACAAAAIVLFAIRLMLTLSENERLARDKEAIIETAGEGILRVDADGRITHANRAAARMVGRPARQLRGIAPGELFKAGESGETYPSGESPIEVAIRSGAPRRVSDGALWRPDGTSFPIDYTIAPLREAGQIAGGVVVFDDVTPQRTLEARLRHEANHDSLTGLLNRRRFLEELDGQIRHSRRYGRPAALILLDLDSFKLVNDSFGHAAGDDTIRSVAGLIGARVRSTDAVGRLGGDEFAVLLREAAPDDALMIANSILKTTKANTEPAIDASVGIVTFDGSGPLSAGELMVGADIALYEAKQKGGHRAVRWDGSKGARLAWVEEIREALDEDRFTLFAQPIIDLHTGKVIREELLLRLINRHGDVVPPSAFLPTAERFGLIGDIDRLVVAKAVELARGGRRLSINLSGGSLGDQAITSTIAEAVASGVDAGALTFEITETAAVANMNEARTFATHLERLGCALMLDDFGTGLSSLGYLKQIPVQGLKIDIEFVAGLAENSLNQYVVRLIGDIAHRLGQHTVAEGVEDVATLATLRSLGVDCAQGYLIGRPAPVSDGIAERPVEVREALAAPVGC